MEGLRDSLLSSFATSERINAYLISNLDERAWRTVGPGGRGRTIAAIVAHIHNVRHMWLVVAARGTRILPKLDRARVTRAQALAALGRSHAALEKLAAKALDGDGRIRGFRPDVVGFLGYLMTHDAHHRGQISLLARQVGYPLSTDITFGMWDWGKQSRVTR
jgi:uncharacterized damage-inducible protein DinB